jgi:membrane-anchored protein YejM (alkaline phosphatase superfamily)
LYGQLQNDWSIQEAGMAQLDDIVGEVMKKLKEMGVDENTIVVFTTDNGAENSWPDGGQTPFAGGKGSALEVVGQFERGALAAHLRCPP